MSSTPDNLPLAPILTDSEIAALSQLLYESTLQHEISLQHLDDPSSLDENNGEDHLIKDSLVGAVRWVTKDHPIFLIHSPLSILSLRARLSIWPYRYLLDKRLMSTLHRIGRSRMRR